jgi:hypothetical protein
MQKNDKQGTEKDTQQKGGVLRHIGGEVKGQGADPHKLKVTKTGKEEGPTVFW